MFILEKGDAVSLKGVDLGMLEALVVLVEERHVSRAASRLSMTQSSLSYTLSRLRDVLKDPVLVRTGAGMVPSARALDLVESLSGPMQRIAKELSRDGPFVPKEAAPHFRIAASGFATAIVMPRLMRTLLAKSPRCTMEVLPTSRITTRHQLETGKVDLALGFWPDLADTLISKTLLREELCILASPGSDYAEALAAEDIAQVGFSAYTTGEGMLVNYELAFDKALEIQNVRRRIVFQSSSMQVIPNIMALADLVAVIPRRAASVMLRTHSLRIVDTDIEMPHFPMQAIWHQRTQFDEANRWMRQELEKVTIELRNLA